MIKHVDMPLSKLQWLAREANLEPGANFIDWYLNTQAPGRLVGVTSFLQPRPGSQVSPQGPQIEPCFHFFFEVPSVIQ